MALKRTKRERVIDVKVEPLAEGEPQPLFRVRHVRQSELDQIRDECSTEEVTQFGFMQKTDRAKQRARLATAYCVGWENVTPALLLERFAHPGYDEVETDANGFVLFSEKTLIDLWIESPAFVVLILGSARTILEAEVKAKNGGAPSSGE